MATTNVKNSAKLSNNVTKPKPAKRKPKSKRSSKSSKAPAKPASKTGY